MSLTLSTLGGTNLPKQFRYAVVEPRRATYAGTQRSGKLFVEGKIVQEDVVISWSSIDSTRAEYVSIRALFRANDPSYLFIGAHDTTNDRYHVYFDDLPDVEPDSGGLYQLSGQFRVLRKAHADATVTVLDYADLGGAVVTVSIWDGTGSTDTDLTEGVDWTAATSNADTATSLAAAIDALTGVSAAADGAVITVTAGAAYAINSITTDADESDLLIDYDFDMDAWGYFTRGVWTGRMVS